MPRLLNERKYIFATFAVALIVVSFLASKAFGASGLDDDVKLLLHGGVGDNIVTTLRDSSFSDHTVTLNGDAKRAVDKFSQSGFFDGSGDFLSIPSDSVFEFGTGDFTVDFWVRFNALSGLQYIYDPRPDSTQGVYPSVYVDGTTLKYWVSSADRITGGTTLVINTWYHIAVARSGTQTKLFLNGVQQGSTYTDSNSYISSAVRFGRGAFGAQFLNGTLDEVRISKGVARWTDNFTPPTSPHSSDANTSLLLHMDGTSGSTTFTDSSGSPKTVTANGNAVISSFSKFGGDGIIFDGSGDFASVPDSADFAFGSGNFTIDFWVRATETTTQRTLISKRANQSVWAPFIVTKGNGVGNNGLYTFYSSSNGSSGDIANAVTFGSVIVNQWQHVAISRSGNNIYLFVDGVLGNTISTSASLMSNSDLVRIGSESNGLGFHGSIDEVRISKGVARWTSNFTPPTEAYGLGPAITLSGNVKFLRNIAVIDKLSKGAGTFVIDHPQKPRTHLLYHSFVESNEVKNLYDGIVELDANGEAVIRLPDYFEKLNKDFRYQYFPIGAPMPNLYVKEKVKNNQFVLAGGQPGGRVSWQVTGVRHDPYIEANPLQVEVEKGPNELVDKRECLHAEACQ